jgi:multidrug efflux pump subunit AcrA (membrane-fusion protein)
MKLLRTQLLPQPGRRWWQQRTWRWIALLITVMLIPVRQTVMAVGELVPAHPAVIRAPLDGVVDVFHVQPNQMVSKNQPLFGFDEALIQSHLDVARQALATTETDYRQTSQQALNDARFRPQLAMLSGKIEEKRAEVDFLAEQLTRARVLAPQDGVAMFDDPTEWIGRPVVVGERIMRIASPQDTEVEAWLPLADAIALPSGAPVNLYLHSSPLMAVSAKLRYMAHDAVQRSDGSFAYRVRATLDSPTDHRVGLKGTAKLHGGWVPLVYWMLRRPLASVRSALGV